MKTKKTTKNFARGRVWQKHKRIQTTIRVPLEVHKELCLQAVKYEMSMNDYILSLLDIVTSLTSERQTP